MEWRVRAVSKDEFVNGPLAELTRQGLTALFQRLLEWEADTIVDQLRHAARTSGRQRIVRNGYMPARVLRTAVGDIFIQVPRIRDREGKARFRSAVVPPYLRNLDVPQPALMLTYLRSLMHNDPAPLFRTLAPKGNLTAARKGIKDLWNDHVLELHSEQVLPESLERIWIGRCKKDILFGQAPAVTDIVVARCRSGAYRLLGVFVGRQPDEVTAVLSEALARWGLAGCIPAACLQNRGTIELSTPDSEAARTSHGQERRGQKADPDRPQASFVDSPFAHPHHLIHKI
ncbi:MAG TPA: transposase [Candidatus Obscuribacterales bacterium]